MRHPDLSSARLWCRLQGRTVRFRLTLLCGALFLAAGAALLAITYVLIRSSDSIVVARARTPHHLTIASNRLGFAKGQQSFNVMANGRLRRAGPGSPTAAQVHEINQLRAQALATHASDLHQMLIESGLALAIMAVLAIGLGWIVAGRVLRPLRLMRNATQKITEHNLHRRLAMPGPSDEIKDLADTIDGLLGRLETAFDSQRRFVANASHELRTPLTLERALVEVALADPYSTSAELRAALQDVLASSEQQERLIEALLTLATSERGVDRWDQVDLVAVTRHVLDARRDGATGKGLSLNEAFAPALVTGDPDLIERLVANLVDNSIFHNVPGGSIEIIIGTPDDRPTLVIANTGPGIRSADVERLFQPYQRLARSRVAHSDGHGLGLSIVQAIASAHGAIVEARPRPAGGLQVQVRFAAHRNASLAQAVLSHRGSNHSGQPEPTPSPSR